MHLSRTPLRRRLAAGAVTAITALGGLAVLAPTTASAAPVPITGGHIEWGVRQAFRSYVTGPIAHGTITVGSTASPAATVNRAPAVSVPVRTRSDQTVQGTDTYRFGVLPGGTNDSATRTASVSSGGVVRFQGHDGQLDLVIDQVRVSVNGNTGTLVADVTSKSMANPSAPASFFDDVALASLDLTGITPTSSGGTTTYASIPAKLTEAGVPAFSSYPAGTDLDPVTLVLRDAEPTPAAVAGRAVTSGNVRWTISRQVWGQTSLNQCLVASDGATLKGTPSDSSFSDPANGVEFAVASGRYDKATGATQLDLDGTVVIGNRGQGNYRIKLADPAMTIDASGNGVLTADVSYSLPPGGAPPATCDLTGRTFVAGGDDVVIATWDGKPTGAIEATGAFTPHFAENVYSADPRFTGALDQSLRGHFSVSNGNPNTEGAPAVEASHRKALQPIRLFLQTAAPVATTLTLSPASAAPKTGTQHCVTATVLDDLSEAVSGAEVSFTRTGANAGTGSAATGATGTAQHCYTGAAAGADTITASSGSLTGSATATWAKPNWLSSLLTSIYTFLLRLIGWA